MKRNILLYLRCLLLFIIRNDSLKICFHVNRANERGTAIAIFDYANYAEKLLGHESHLIFPSKLEDTIALEKFKNRFNNVTFYDGNVGNPNLPKHALNQSCNLLYLLKSGEKDSPARFPDAFSPDLKTAVHAVFIWDPHGTAYAAISPTVHPTHDNNFVVPHMVTKPYVTASNTTLRRELGIPTSALTVCRHGGFISFSLKIAHTAIKSLVELFNEKQLQFIFLNTESFITNAKVHFLKKTVDTIKKEEFFSACDVMLHARKDGETFGLAVAEFSIRQKPVITANLKGVPGFHIEILGDRGFYYQTEQEIINIISGKMYKFFHYTKITFLGFIKNGIPKKDYNAYTEFTPEKVMDKFKKLFIDTAQNVDSTYST